MAIQPAPRSPLLDEALGPGGPIIVFDRVHLAFDDKVILRDISFTLKTGHTKIFLGASGAGKSTILRLILGLLTPDAGQIFVNGERVDNMSEDQLLTVRGDLGMVFQEGALFDSLTVRENVGYKLFEESRTPIAQVDARVKEVLGFVGLLEFINRMPSELSGGQRRRVAIARAMAAKPRILLYDEPTTGLDPKSRRDVQSFLEALRQRAGTTILLTTHDMAEAERLCARIGFLAHGKLVAEGTADALKQQAAAATLDDAFIKLTGEGLSKDEEQLEEMAVLEGV